MIRRVDCLGCEFDEIKIDEGISDAVEAHLENCDAGIRVDTVEAVRVDCLGCGFDAVESDDEAIHKALVIHETETGHSVELEPVDRDEGDHDVDEVLTDGGIPEHYWVECRFCGKQTVAFERFCRHCDADRQQHRDENARADGGRSVDELVVTSGFVADHAVPADEATTYVHLGLDDAYHPIGGYWFPSDIEPDGEMSGWVHREGEIPIGDLIQYPRDDREPRIVGRDTLPEWVENRVVREGDPIPDGGRVVEGQVFGECPNGHGDEDGVIAAEVSAAAAPYPNCPICGLRLENTVSTDGGRRVDPGAPNPITGVSEWGSRDQVARLSNELDTVFSRHNELVRARPDLVVALLVNMADGLRDKFNLDIDVDVVGENHVVVLVDGDGAAGLLGFVRDDDGQVDVSHIPDHVDLGGESR